MIAVKRREIFVDVDPSDVIRAPAGKMSGARASGKTGGGRKTDEPSKLGQQQNRQQLQQHLQQRQTSRGSTPNRTPASKHRIDVTTSRGGLEFQVTVNNSVAKGKSTPLIKISAVESKIPRLNSKPPSSAKVQNGMSLNIPTALLSNGVRSSQSKFTLNVLVHVSVSSRTLKNGKPPPAGVPSLSSSVRARREASIMSTSSSSSQATPAVPAVSKTPARKKSVSGNLSGPSANKTPAVLNARESRASSLPRLKRTNLPSTGSVDRMSTASTSTLAVNRSGSGRASGKAMVGRQERSPARPPRVIGVVPKTSGPTPASNVVTPSTASKRRRLPQKPTQGDSSSSDQQQSKPRPVKNSVPPATPKPSGDDKRGKIGGKFSESPKKTTKLTDRRQSGIGGGGVGGAVVVPADPPPQFADTELVLSPPQEFSDSACTVVIQEPDGDTDSSTGNHQPTSWRRVGTAALGASILSPVMPDVVLVSVPAFTRSKSAGDLPSPVKCDKYQVEEPDDDQEEYLARYIDSENTFQVMLNKTSQGLGLSIMGGASEGEAGEEEERPQHKPRRGFIRIKKIYPMTPAWECGNLLPGDIVLSANGVSLTGMTCSQALEILRTTPRVTVLEVCRLPMSVEENKAPGTTTSSANTQKKSSRENLLSPILSPCGEFEVTLKKVNGSLGFTLRKEDDSILGHYIRALVKEPAISDGRIHPGDKIVSVNGVDISGKTHAEAVAFLRSCPEIVTLRLYRDMGQTPVSPLSPSLTSIDEPDDSRARNKASRSPSTLKKNKLKFRQEAQDMLKGLALQRGKTPPNSSPNFNSLGRQRRLKQMQNSSASSATSFSSGVAAGGTEVLIGGSRTRTLDGDKPKRPTYLDLSLDSPGSKKQKFVFTPPSSYRDKGQGSDGEGNSLEISDPLEHSPSLDFPDLDTDSFLNEVLDACDKTQKTGSFLGVTAFLTDRHDDDGAGDSEYSSTFGHRTPGYQSVNLTSTKDGKCAGMDSANHVASTHFSDQDIPHQFTSLQKTTAEYPTQADKIEGTQGLLKWRGTVFNADGSDGEDEDSYENSLGPPPSLPPPSVPTNEAREIILTLQRGWNSRLGFSLRSYTDDGKSGSYVSAIYAESVAYRDGRLRAGDRLMRVNTTDVSTMPTGEVIGLLRTLRGTILLTLIRPAPVHEE